MMDPDTITAIIAADEEDARAKGLVKNDPPTSSTGRTEKVTEEIEGAEGVPVAGRSAEDVIASTDSDLQLPERVPVIAADPLVLQRARPNWGPNDQLPGAYMGAPGEALQRNTTLDYDLLLGGANNSSNNNGNNNDAAVQNSNTNDDLAVANLVPEEDQENANLMHANPVNLQDQERKQKAIKKQQQTIMFVLALVIIAAAAIIGTVAGTRNDQQEAAQTPTPTTFDSMEPSQNPSSAPTGNLDVLLNSLPDNTIASLNNGSETPQWKAWNWLSNHQNLTNLPEWKKEQLFALACFFYAYEGEKWWKPLQDRWMDDTIDECEWFSAGDGYFLFDQYYEHSPDFAIPPCNDQGKFTSLFMSLPESSQAVSIDFPPEITLLTSLARLHMIVFNSKPTTLKEMIPMELYHMTTLELLWLVIVDGSLGALPTELGLMRGLRTLGVPTVSGQIPSELGMLTQLTIFDVSHSDASGTIPTEIGLWTLLERFSLEHLPFLSGNIPREIGKMTRLTSLNFVNVQLTGQLPSELGLATALEEIWLSDNAFTGGLPSEIVRLTSLRSLRLKNNMLSGPLPSQELLMMTGLKGLHLGQNDFTGTIPSEYGEIGELIRLQLNGLPLLSGSIPSEFGNLAALRYLWLNDLPLLGGPIPSELDQMTSLVELNISGTPSLSGTLPEQFCFLQNSTCTQGRNPCILEFACSDQLCGCDCSCPNSNVTAN